MLMMSSAQTVPFGSALLVGQTPRRADHRDPHDLTICIAMTCWSVHHQAPEVTPP